MMSSVIHMEIEHVEQAIQSLRTAVQEGKVQEQQLYRAGRTLHWAWQGPSAESFIGTLGAITRCYTQLIQTLEILVEKLQYEKEEWLAVDANSPWKTTLEAAGLAATTTSMMGAPGSWEWVEDICGARQDADRCRSIWAQPPRHAGDLAYMISSLPEDTPIAILNLGNGEVLVLLKGTDPDDPERGNNWGSAVESFFTHQNSYQLSVIKALKEAKDKGLIPQNAKLHIAGHSQGGMVAQNLAVDPRLQELGIKVETVVTFGSPDTFSKANPDTKYIMFEHATDRVAQIDEFVELGLGEMSQSQDPRIKIPARIAKIYADLRLNDVERIAERHVLQVPDSSAIIDHDYARDSVYRELSKYDLPFPPDKKNMSWHGHGFYRTEIQTPVAKLYQKLGENIKRIFKK